jgi:hypothetical protein
LLAAIVLFFGLLLLWPLAMLFVAFMSAITALPGHSRNADEGSAALLLYSTVALLPFMVFVTLCALNALYSMPGQLG